MTGLTFKNVTKRFGEVTAVDDFNLDVGQGEFVALVGPSGCGKTTSLRIMAGLEEATYGHVFVGGRDVSRVAARDRNLAMVFQSYALYPHMTAAENIGFALRLQRMPRSEVDHRVRQVADRLGIGRLLHRRPKELSGGQRQRVAVARCIIREPAAFLFDEPLSNLDAKLRGAARVEIAKLQKALGVTTIYVTHDQVEAMTMADRIVLMDGGRVRQTGRPMELYNRPRDLVVAAFLGSPPMNLLPGRIICDGSMVEFVGGGVRLALPGAAAMAEGEATLGIRPENLVLTPGPPHGSGPAGPVLWGTVSHVEHLGAEALVEFSMPEEAPGRRLVARLGRSCAVRVGDRGHFSTSLSDLHLFDADGLALPPLGAAVPPADRELRLHA